MSSQHLLAVILSTFPMNKQIATLIMLGLVLTVGVLATIYPEHAGAIFGRGFGGNGVNPGLPTPCTTPAAAHNPHC